MRSVNAGHVTPARLDFHAVTFGALGAKGSDGTSTGSSGFCKGTYVFDASHKANRGYGVVESPWPELDDDGDERCRVRFEGGVRATMIKCKYLEVPAISPELRQDPTATQQRVLVVVGPHKNKEGATVKKVGG